MAEIQQWRRLVQMARSKAEPLDHTYDINNQDRTLDTSISSQQIRSETETRPTPKSRLASYLSTHRGQAPADKMEAPAFDRTPTKERDKVHDPDLEAMCNILRTKIMTFPFDELPVQYNSSVLRLIAGYQKLIEVRNSLQDTLDAISSRQSQASIITSGARLSSDSTQSHELHASQDIERRSLDTPSTIDDPSIQQSMRRSGDNLTVKKFRSKALSRWPPSPSRSMARLSRKFSEVNPASETEPYLSSSIFVDQQAGPVQLGNFSSPLHPLKLQSSNGTMMSDRSSIGGDLLPDEEEALQIPGESHRQIAVHLAEWVAQRTGSVIDDVLPEVLKVVSLYGEHNAALDAAIESNTNAPATAIKSASHTGKPHLARPLFDREHKPNEKIMQGSTEPDSRHHRRGFSFVPGDDARASRTLRPAASTISSTGLRLPSDKDNYDIFGPASFQPETEPTHTKVYQNTIPEPRYRADEPQRESSNRSVMTAIHNGSFSNSSAASKLSGGSEMNAKKYERPPSSSKRGSMAAAAARTAGRNSVEPK